MLPVLRSKHNVRRHEQKLLGEKAELNGDTECEQIYLI
jgi:hypothetical protein